MLLVFNFFTLAINVIHCQENKKFSYFPLTVGNKWFFSDGHDGVIKIKLEIQKDTILNDSYTYAKINKYTINSDSSSKLNVEGYSYLKIIDNRVVEYPDRTIMDYDMSIGDTVWSFREQPILSVLNEIRIKNVFGRNLSTYRFHYNGFEFYSYTDSIGFNTLWETDWHNWYPNYLLGCEVDGITYGNVITGIEIKNESYYDYKLYQNYPNPFNPITKIQYSIPKASFVSLIIYDMLGKEVVTLVNDYKNIGNYVIEFNAAKLASGIYFYTLSSGKYIQTNKMLLLR
jgi:hypothetical protein